MNDDGAKEQQRQPVILGAAKGAGIAWSGQIFMTIVTYLTSFVLARLLGARLYGAYLLGFSVVTVVANVAGLGTNAAALRFVALYKGRNDARSVKGFLTYFSELIGLLGVLSVVALLLSSQRISAVLNLGNFVTFLRWISPVVPLMAIQSFWSSSVQAYGAIRYRVLTESVFRPGFFLIFGVLLIWSGQAMHGIAIALLLSYAVSLSFLGFYAIRIFPFVFDHRVSRILRPKVWLAFCLPVYLDNLFGVLAMRTNIFALGYMQTASDVGIYGVAQRISQFVLMPLVAFNMVSAPLFAEFHGRGDISGIGGLFKVVTKWTFSMSFGIFMLTVLSGRFLLHLLGSEFESGFVLLCVLSLAQVLDSLSGPVGYVLLMTGRAWIYLFNSLMHFGTALGMSLLLVPKYSLLGAGIAWLLSGVLVNLIRLGEVYFYYGIHPYRLDFLKPILAGIITGISAFLFVGRLPVFGPEGLRISVLAISMMAIYGLSLWLLGLEEEDKIVMEAVGRWGHRLA